MAVPPARHRDPRGPAENTDVLVARDAYGDRFLLVAPFSDPARPAAVDHWYAWDLDWCVHGLVVAASVPESPGQALAEWRAAVGPAAAEEEFGTCPPELGIRLLDPALSGSLQSESVFGDEPAGFFREIPRLSRRATALVSFLGRRLTGERSALPGELRDEDIEDFLDQRAGRAWNSPEDRDTAEEALETLLCEWGPDIPPDDRAFFACSPHRIQGCTAILRDIYEPGDVDRALRLLPDWVRWCAGKAGLDGEFTDRAVTAAVAARASGLPDSSFRCPE